MKFINMGNKLDASHYVAAELFKAIHFHRCTLLGLATGGTMESVYEKLVELIQLNNVDISCLETFNLDEYFMLDDKDPHSYMTYMREHLFDKIGMKEHQFHLPDNDDINVEHDNEAYDKAIRQKGPLDIQLLGIGENGHIGFNEPGTPFNSKTRVVELSQATIEANARFFDDKEQVPTKAVSMGIETIMFSKRIILLALGDKKAKIMADLYHMERPDEMIPASSLLNHPNVEIVMDDEAAKYINEKIHA